MTSNGQRNIANCSWGDHLVFGEGDGLLRTVESLERRMDAWVEELGADTVHWRQGRTGHDDVYQAARGYGGKKRQLYPPITWDDFEVVPRLARERGMRAYAYVSLLDPGASACAEGGARGESSQSVPRQEFRPHEPAHQGASRI